MEQTHTVLSHRHGPEWILEGDIKACFDKISHPWLLAHVPMDRQVLRKWLRAGFLEKHAWFATTEGTPQGGCISPALANWTLDGLQRLLEDHFAKTPKQRRINKVHLVRYADDFLITGTSKQLLGDQVQPLVAHFLKQRGLELSHEKTQITHVEEGFDFLGQNVRRYRCGKVLTKPSSQSVKTFLSKIQETIDNSGSLTAGELIRRLNQQIKGWVMYHR
jgi:RNA-directed DNA polymerase